MRRRGKGIRYGVPAKRVEDVVRSKASLDGVPVQGAKIHLKVVVKKLMQLFDPKFKVKTQSSPLNCIGSHQLGKNTSKFTLGLAQLNVKLCYFSFQI